jgi:hypothetical protein
MHRRIIQSLISLLLAGVLSFGIAASPAIGVAVASGSFRVDGARVAGNSSVFEGDTIETGVVQSEVQLNGGVRMRLGAESRGRFYRDRMALERGQAQLDASSGYRMEALNLSVAAEPSAGARVSLSGPRRVQVAAFGGSVRVANTDGVLLAMLTPGKVLEFETDVAGAAAPYKLTGILREENGHFFLTDETSKTKVELKGENLKAMVGKRVQVTGNADPAAVPAKDATQVVVVAQATVLSAGAAAVGAGAAAATAASHGAIIAGVAVAGAGAAAGIGYTVVTAKASTSR